MPNAVIFDLDNTLIDFVERKKLVIIEAVKAMMDAGLEGEFQKLHRDFSNFYWKKGIEDQHIFQKFLKKRLGAIDYRILAYAILAYRRVNSGLLRPYPSAKHVLLTLKERGYKLGILTDAPRLEAYLRLCAVGFDDFFDAVVTRDDSRHVKPDSRCFRLIAKGLCVNLKDCIMVGDNNSRDIVGAKKLGMKTIYAKYGRIRAEKITADFTAGKIDDILKFLNGHS